MSVQTLVRPALPEVGSRIVRLDPFADPRWERFVESHPERLLFHHSAWLGVLREAFGYQPIGLACEDSQGGLRGVLAIVESRGTLTGHRFTSLPHSALAGPLSLDDQAAAALLRAALQLTRSTPGAELHVRAATDGLGKLVDDLIEQPWRPSYVLDLPGDPAELTFGSARNRARLKWAVGKASKRGVRIRPAEKEAELWAWYRLHVETMRWHAQPPPPYRFFRSAWEHLRPHGWLRLLLAEHSEAARTELVAGSIFLCYGQTVYYMSSGWKRSSIALRPNDAIHWQTIHDACLGGFRTYDFGEVEETNHGLSDFKSKWGARRIQHYRLYYPAPRELEGGVIAERSQTRLLAEAIWRRLPLPIVARLGGWLYCKL